MLQYRLEVHEKQMLKYLLKQRIQKYIKFYEYRMN